MAKDYWGQKIFIDIDCGRYRTKVPMYVMGNHPDKADDHLINIFHSLAWLRYFMPETKLAGLAYEISGALVKTIREMNEEDD